MRGRLPLLLALAALAGCGPTPPQVPKPLAQKVDEATSGISSSCGLAYQATAFGVASRRDLATLEASASARAIELASVYRLNPEWIYQGETLHKIVSDASSMLDSCHLLRAARVLSQARR